jgi:hypothetical protein
MRKTRYGATNKACGFSPLVLILVPHHTAEQRGVTGSSKLRPFFGDAAIFCQSSVSAQKMMIRVRTPSGMVRVNVANAQTYAELAIAVAQALELPSTENLTLKLCSSNPPKEIEATPDTPFAALGLSNGELLMVDEKKLPSLTPTSTAAATMSFAPSATATPKLANPIPTSTSAPKQPVENGMIRRVIASDNSCLFNSVGYVFRHSLNMAQELREMCAATVLSDPETYTDVMLGKPTEEYCNWFAQAFFPSHSSFHFHFLA